jgi:hypothetical protein
LECLAELVHAGVLVVRQKGDVLFRIDPRHYQYVVEQKRAALAESEQNVLQLKCRAGRGRGQRERGDGDPGILFRGESFDQLAERDAFFSCPFTPGCTAIMPVNADRGRRSAFPGADPGGAGQLRSKHVGPTQQAPSGARRWHRPPWCA